MPKFPKLPPKGPNDGHWRAGRKFPWWKDENRVWSKRRGFRQKPWNKVQRREKFWVPWSLVRTANQNQEFGTTGTPQQVVFWDPFTQNTEGVAAFNFTGRSFSRVKVHRLDGYIRAWSPAHGFGSDVPPDDPPFVPPWIFLDYWWLIADKATDTHDAGTFPATSMNPSAYSSGDLFEILSRDDVLRWGSLELQPSTLPVHTVTAGVVVGTDLQRKTFERGMVHIPFPRIGKMGLNIPRGKALVLVVAARAAVDGNNGYTIDDGQEAQVQTVVTEATFRALCS